MKTVRCVVCRSEFSDDEIVGALQCPKCGDTGVPMSISEDIEVKINWHELRILCIWAKNFAESISKETTGATETVDAIVDSLSKYRPCGAAPLSVKEEFQEMADTQEQKINPKKMN